MYIYNVTVNTESSISEEWLEWMRSKHIPDVLASGCFISHRLCRLLNVEDEGKTFCVQYFYAKPEDLEHYQKNFAKKLQAEHAEKFGNRALAFRTLMEIVE
jgi:hypothetical protein